MTVRSRVRKIYERRPYPPPALREKVSLSLPAPEWIATVAENAPGHSPSRILVAGCGVGTEAFALARRFPGADVFGVDFSPRSIAMAKRLGRTIDGSERITFAVADLTSPDLVDITGGRFDFVSCNGVLSYVADVPAVLQNFRHLLTRDGVLLLGVNGASHPSGRWRPLFAEFGIDPDEFRDSPRVRDVIRVCESVTIFPPTKVADLDAGYLAGDIFGPLNRALPLSEWTRLCGQAGLHFFGAYHAFFAVRALINLDLHPLLMPRTRAQLAKLIDAVQPTSFHRMVLSRRRPFEAPWSDGTALMRCRPALTPLYKTQLPRRNRRWHQLREVKLESSSANTSVTLNVPEWEIEILEKSDGVKTLREILSPVKPAVSAKSLREALYLLYLLGAVNLRS